MTKASNKDDRSIDKLLEKQRNSRKMSSTSSQINLYPVCEIKMRTENDEKLMIRVDRGHRPLINLNSTENHVQIYVPLDTSVNYQPITQDIGLGYVVKLQRMQQQYKITLQHLHEKKPECVVFASNSVHEQEIKTTVKEVNSKLANMTIAGSNLEVNGVLKGNNLTFESTVGTMHVYAKITCTGSLNFHSQNIVLSTEALLSTDVFKAICRKLQIDGRIFPLEIDDEAGLINDEEKPAMNVDLSCGLVHIGVDGCVGASNEKEKSIKSGARLKASKQIIAPTLRLNIAGDLANYGKILAKDRIDLSIGGCLISLSDGSLDSAGRGYTALKKLRRVDGENGCAPSSSTMHNAIQSQNAEAVANLIEKGIDLNDKVSRTKNSVKTKRLTLRQTAINEYKEAREKSDRNSVRARITLINALFEAHDWKRGSISAISIEAVIARHCEDTAQFSAKNLKIKVGGSATVEKDSIWSSTWVEMDVRSHVIFNGQTKTRTLTIHSGGNVITSGDAILSFEIFCRISCVNFDSDGMWCAGESLAIETIGNTIFQSGSYIETERLDINCRNIGNIDGTLQLSSCWIHVRAMLTIQQNSKMFIEDTANISALGLHFNGFCHVGNQLELIVQDSAHFFGSSRLEAHIFQLTCKGFCTIGGLIAVNDLSIYVRHELITMSTAKLSVVNDSEVTIGVFRNDAMWQIEKNLKMIVGAIEQSEDGTLFVKLSMNISIYEESIESFGGKLVSSEIQIKTLKKCTFDGLIRCNEMQLSIPYVDQSIMTLKGQTDIVAGSLTVNGNLKIDDETNSRSPVNPGLIIGSNLTAAAIVAPFVSVHIDSTAFVRLNGLESCIEDEFNVLLNCGALSTSKGSVILSMADQTQINQSSIVEEKVKMNQKRIKAEAILCATTFHHCGQIKFSGIEVNILSAIFIHEGRLTNVENKQNHVRHLFIHIADLLINNGILACDILEIIGDGILENSNRIYAVESMDIKLRNFNNDDGLIESKNCMKLLAVSKEWTKVGGSIKAKKPIDLCANRLNVAIRNVHNLSIDKRLSFSAKTDLLISSDIIDESKELSIGCAAQQSVAIDCQMQLDRLEVLLGSDNTNESEDPVTLIIHQNSNLMANTILINAKSENVHVLFDGNVQCNRMRFAGNIKNVTIVGSGNLESTQMVLPNSRISFEMYSIVRIEEIQCLSFDVLNEHILRLEAVDGEDTTTIMTQDINIEGTLFLEKKVFIKSREGVVHLNGAIVGSSPTSELACECTKMVVKGQLGNFKFAELFSRESISIQNEKIRNVDKLCIECGELSIYNAEIESCRNVSINCDSLTASGYIQGEANSTLTIHSINIHSKINISNLDRFTIFSKRSTTIKGCIENVNHIDVDSKWINMSCEIEKTKNVKLTGWAITNNNQIRAENIRITSLSVFVNNSSILASALSQIVATFVLSVTPLSTITADQLDVYSLCFCSRNDVTTNGTNYLWLNFDPLTKIMGATNSELNSWKTTFALLRDRWMTTSLDADEILIGLKYISDLQPIKISLNTQNSVYESLTEMCFRFENTPISLFNFGEFITLLQTTKSLLQQFQDTNGGKKKRRSDGSLYEALVQFKHGKYSKETNESSDTDIGYVSRSSSEDLNSKSSRPRSPIDICLEATTSFFEPTHLESVEEIVDEAEKQLRNDIEMDHVAYAIKEEEELAEFEQLEDEIEMAEEGIIRTDFIICKDRNIYLARLKEKVRLVSAPRPKLNNLLLQRIPSSNDLIMKKLQVKHEISSLDLRSFGSQSSLASLDFGTLPDFGCPLQFNQSSPFQRSKIPIGSFRSPRKGRSRCGTPTMYSSSTLSAKFNE